MIFDISGVSRLFPTCTGKKLARMSYSPGMKLCDSLMARAWGAGNQRFSDSMLAMVFLVKFYLCASREIALLFPSAELGLMNLSV